MQKGAILVASHSYSTGSRNRREKMSLFIFLPSFLKSRYVFFSLTTDCCTISIWIVAPSEQLCIDLLWVCSWKCSVTVKHFIMVNLKRSLCCLQLNIDLLNLFNLSFRTSCPYFTGHFYNLVYNTRVQNIYIEDKMRRMIEGNASLRSASGGRTTHINISIVMNSSTLFLREMQKLM